MPSQRLTGLFDGATRSEAEAMYRDAASELQRAVRLLQAGEEAVARRLASSATATAKAAQVMSERLAEAAAKQTAHDQRMAWAEAAVARGADQRSELACVREDIRSPQGPHVRLLVEAGAEYVMVLDSATTMPKGGNPRSLVLAATLEARDPCDAVERIHRAFRAEHASGAWFSVSERFAAFVLEVRHGHDVSWLLEAA